MLHIIDDFVLQQLGNIVIYQQIRNLLDDVCKKYFEANYDTDWQHYSGWSICDKFIFFEKHWIPFIIVPMVSEYHNIVFAKNGKEIKAGYVHSWNRYYEQFNE